MALHPARSGDPHGEPDMGDLADEDGAAIDQECARIHVNAGGGHGRLRAVRAHQVDGAIRGDLALAPARTVELPVAKVVDARPQPVEEGRRATRRGRSGPDASSANDVIASARSGGKSPRGQAPFTPIPITARGSSVPIPSLSPSTPASFLSPPGPSTTRSFGHFNAIVPDGSRAISSPASAIASDVIAASRHS